MAHAGLVCASGTCMTGWDPRQQGTGPSPTPAFIVADRGPFHTIISADGPESGGPPQLVVGVPQWQSSHVSK